MIQIQSFANLGCIQLTVPENVKTSEYPFYFNGKNLKYIAMPKNYFNYDGMTKAIAKTGIRARVSVGAKIGTPDGYDCYSDLKSQVK